MKRSFLILDVETTIKNKGNPFTDGNKLCYVGFHSTKDGHQPVVLDVRADQTSLWEVQDAVNSHEYLVAFNAKFDCHWLENVGIDLSRIKIWDCQYAEFIFENQRNPYPSLEKTGIKYGFGVKEDEVKKYWEKGVDTLDIPYEIMVQYLYRDVELTKQVFEKQYELFNGKESSRFRLFLLHMEDQTTLREMERNGIYYDVKRSLVMEKNAEVEIARVEQKLMEGYDGIPINFDSVDHLSAYLYGGSISIDSRLPVGTFKTGAKIGQPRYKIVTHTYNLPKLVEPLPKSELKKEGLYATDEKTLKQLRGTKALKERISLLDERSKLEKLRGTYYGGFPKKIAEMAWSNDIIHSSLNQCVAVTGRLSSTNPNQQNIPPECKLLCVSRY